MTVPGGSGEFKMFCAFFMILWRAFLSVPHQDGMCQDTLQLQISFPECSREIWHLSFFYQHGGIYCIYRSSELWVLRYVKLDFPLHILSSLMDSGMCASFFLLKSGVLLSF